MRFQLKALLAAVPLLAGNAAAQWPNPQGAQVQGVRDPSLIRRESDGQYFLFGTNGNGTLHTASSINGPWTRVGGGVLNVTQDVVAPQVYLVNGTYYMYYSQHTGPTSEWDFTADVHVASSTTMEPGSWIEHGELAIPSDNQKLLNHASNDGYNVLDASLLEANGTYYLSFGSYYSGIYQAEMSSPLDLTDPNVTVTGLNHLEVNNTANHSTEGSFQFAWPTNSSAPTKYYLFFSSGQCCKFAKMGVPPPGDAYKVMVCRSDNPTGPFVDQDGKDCLNDNGGTVVLGSHGSVWAPGGQGAMYSDEVGGVILYYMYLPADARTERPILTVSDDQAYFGWNMLDFGSDGWPKLVGANDTSRNMTSEASFTSNPAGRVRVPWIFRIIRPIFFGAARR